MFTSIENAFKQEIKSLKIILTSNNFWINVCCHNNLWFGCTKCHFWWSWYASLSNTLRQKWQLGKPANCIKWHKACFNPRVKINLFTRRFCRYTLYALCIAIECDHDCGQLSTCRTMKLMMFWTESWWLNEICEGSKHKETDQGGECWFSQS